MRSAGTIFMVILMMLAGGLVCEARSEQGITNNEQTALMGEVVVTASRQKEETLRVPANVTVIDAEDIARSNARNVPEALAAAGLHVSDIAGNNRSFTVDLRGFGETAPLNSMVMVDGRRINQPDLSGVDWTVIPIERIARIEVVPGPRGSVLYGDNASGGVINIITQEGAGMEGRLAAHYGSYDTRKGVAGLNGSAGILSFDVTASYLESDGYRDNSDTRAKNAGATLRLDPTDSVSLSFSGGYHEDKTGLPGALLQSDIDSGVVNRRDTLFPDDFADTEDYYMKGGIEFFFLTDDSFRLDLGYRSRSFDSFNSFSGGGTFEGNSDLDTINVSPQFIFQEDFGEVSNRLTLGADFISAQEDIANTFGDASDLEKRNIGYYVHDELGLTPNLSLSGGYRYDRAEFDLSTSGFINDEADFTLDKEAFSVAVNYTYGKAKVYASYGKSFRYPVLDEFFDYPGFRLNAGLKPQTSRTYEAGTRFNLINEITLSVNLFRIDTEHEIFFDPVNFANLNLDGDTSRNGFEVRTDYRSGGWLASAAYTRTDAEIDGGAFDGGEVPNVPENRASFDVSYAFDFGLLLGLNGAYIGSRHYISDFGNTADRLENYTVLNAKVQYAWRYLTFFVNLNNILDEEYASYGVFSAGTGDRFVYPSPEFNVLAGVTARFGGE